ncbi:MAG: MBL fold metallo-hydrolase [Bdellovibrionales bacterium]
MKFYISLLLFLIISNVSCATSKFDSPYFEDDKFVNIDRIPEKTFSEFWGFASNFKRDWPESLESTKAEPVVQKVKTGVKWTFINHASFLIQTDGLNIITDPIWSERCSPVSFAGPKRVREASLQYDDLPKKIDLVFISHNHYDHMDLPSLRVLNERFKPIFFVGLNNSPELMSVGIPRDRIIERDWFKDFTLGETTFTFLPAQHWSKRSLFDDREAQWGSMLIRSKEGHKVYHGGDTGYGSHFKMIQEKYGDMDLSFIPIGAYEPRDFMRDQHLNPDDAVMAHLDLKSKESVGMHFGTFELTYESPEQPIYDLDKARLKYKIDKKSFYSPKFGQVGILR